MSKSATETTATAKIHYDFSVLSTMNINKSFRLHDDTQDEKAIHKSINYASIRLADENSTKIVFSLYYNVNSIRVKCAKRFENVMSQREHAKLTSKQMQYEETVSDVKELEKLVNALCAEELEIVKRQQNKTTKAVKKTTTKTA